MAKLTSVRNIQPATIEIGGRLRTIKFDLNAFAELENKYGTVQKAMDAMQTGSMKDIRKVLWAGLIHDEVKEYDEDGIPISYNITVGEVAGWISSPMMLNVASEKLGQAMSEGMPEQVKVAAAKVIQDTQVVDDIHKPATVVLTEAEKLEEAKNV